MTLACSVYHGALKKLKLIENRKNSKINLEKVYETEDERFLETCDNIDRIGAISFRKTYLAITFHNQKVK